MTSEREIAAIRERYARRDAAAMRRRYDLVVPSVYLARQEKERALLRILGRFSLDDRSRMRALDVGCGDGIDLALLARCGFQAQHLYGVDLLPASIRAAAELCPPGMSLVCGNACDATVEPASLDLVIASTVFSSILDDASARELAAFMWGRLRVGGSILVYDFVYDNPRNRDVRAVTSRTIRHYFPKGRITLERLTLAPPLARSVSRVSPALYGVLNACPLLRTHMLCRIVRT